MYQNSELFVYINNLLNYLLISASFASSRFIFDHAPLSLFNRTCNDKIPCRNIIVDDMLIFSVGSVKPIRIAVITTKMSL